MVFTYNPCTCLLNTRMDRLTKLKASKSTIPRQKSSESKPKLSRKKSASRSRKNSISSSPIPNGDKESKVSLDIPIVTKITYKEQEVQTEMNFNIVDDENDIATVSKQVAEAHASMVQSLRGQITKINEEMAAVKATNLKLENDVLSKNELIEIITIEKEAMSEEIETLKQSLAEKNIMIGNLELDLEDMRDERDGARKEYVFELDSGQKDTDLILQQNEILKDTLLSLRKYVLSEISDKNSEILQLSLKCKGIDSLKKHIEELEKEMTLKQSIENELNEFKREIDLRSDTDRMIEVLSTKNVELEYEVKRLLEVNKHLERMETVYIEIEKENEQFLFDLDQELTQKDQNELALKEKLDKALKELRHAQNTVFQFKDHIRKLEDTKRRLYQSQNNMAQTKKEKELEREMLIRSNFELMDKINNMKAQFINYSKIAANGFSHSIENVLICQHIPKQIKCDYGAIDFLSFLQRVSFKVRFCREMLDSFYIFDESSLGGDIASNISSKDGDIKDTFKVLEICPMLVKHDRFIESIQRGLIASYIDKFNDAVNEWAVLCDVEDKYDKLLEAVKENDIRGMIAITDIFGCNDVFRTYLLKNFAEFNPEQKYRAKEKIDKWALYEVLQQTKYNLYTMQIKANQMNDTVASLTPNTETTEPEMNGSYDEHALMNGSFSNQTDDFHDEQDVELPIVSKSNQHRKMEELQSHLTQIVSRALRYCVPSRSTLFGKKSNLNQLKDENYIGIEYDFIERTAQMTRTLVTKQNILADALENVTVDEREASHFDRIGKINRLLDEQSESSQFGIIPSLEALYKHLKALPYALEKVFAVKTEQPMSPNKNVQELKAIASGNEQCDKLYFMHLELEDELQKVKDEMLGKSISTIRTTETEKEDLRTQLFGKKVAPWIQKATEIREELSKADEIRDALESAQAEIKYKHKELVLEKTNTQQIKSRMHVVKLELAKQQSINKDLIHFELEAKDSDKKLMKYVDKNNQLKSQNEKLIKSRNEMKAQLTSYQNTMKKIKLNAKRGAINALDDDDEDTPHLQHASTATLAHHSPFRPHALRRSSSVINSGGRSGRKHHRSSSSLVLTPKNGTFLGLGEPKGSYDPLDNSNDDRIVIGQLHKQLDLNKDYNKLLEQTINSLRHSQNIFNLHKQWVEIKRDLRPLPRFDSMTNEEYKRYVAKKEQLKIKQNVNKFEKEQERDKVKNKEKRLDGLIEFDDKKEEEEEKTECIVSSFDQKQMKKARYTKLQKSLNCLNHKFDKIYSCPKIIDLGIKNKQKDATYNQNVIGRNLRLRDLKLECLQLSKQCKDIQSNFEQDTNTKQQTENSNLTVLGRVDIEGVSHYKSAKHKTKVRVNRKNMVKMLDVLC